MKYGDLVKMRIALKIIDQNLCSGFSGFCLKIFSHAWVLLSGKY